MMNNKLLDNACNSYIEGLKDPFFCIADLQRAVYDGCDWNTNGKRHPKALMVAEKYIAKKDKDLTYTAIDMRAAFEFGAKGISLLIENEQKQIKLSMQIKKEDMQKAMKLICAGQQMMDLAKNFHQEAEELLSKQGEFKTTIKNSFNKLSGMFRQASVEVGKTFKSFTEDEVIDWGEDGEKLEAAVREVFEIDKYEEYGV